jgi:hypothetical protein
MMGAQASMPAIPHVVRRGAVYYWRRRIPARLAESSKPGVLLLGLRTSDPRRARFLGGQVSELVDACFFPFAMTRRLSHQQLQQIFREVLTRHLDKLDAVAAAERRAKRFDPEESRRLDRVMGWVYRLFETRGGDAAVDARAVEQMKADGMSEASVAEVAQTLATMRAQNVAASSAARLEASVREVGGEPSPMNLALAQETIYRAMAEANFATARRYDGVRQEAAALIAAIVTERAATDLSAEAIRRPSVADQHVNAAASASGRAPCDGATPEYFAGFDRAPPLAAAVAKTAGALTLAEHPVVVFGERFTADKTKRGDWDEKAQRQARQIYRLLGKLLIERGVVEPRTLAQRHFAELVDLLGSVAKSYGKSPKDEFRAIAQLRAIGAGKPEAERGVGAGCVNRHLSYLSQLLRFMKAQGVRFDAEPDLKLFRMRIRTRGRAKRAIFTTDDFAAIFALPCFTGCKGWKGGDAFEPGPHIFHRALYFAIPLLYYSGARREEICGL